MKYLYKHAFWPYDEMNMGGAKYEQVAHLYGDAYFVSLHLPKRFYIKMSVVNERVSKDIFM